MGIYSHLQTAELVELRTKLVTSLTDRLTAPTAVGFNGRNVQYQQRTDDIRRAIDAVSAEISQRQGQVTRRPIYLV